MKTFEKRRFFLCRVVGWYDGNVGMMGLYEDLSSYLFIFLFKFHHRLLLYILSISRRYPHSLWSEWILS